MKHGGPMKQQVKGVASRNGPCSEKESGIEESTGGASDVGFQSTEIVPNEEESFPFTRVFFILTSVVQAKENVDPLVSCLQGSESSALYSKPLSFFPLNNLKRQDDPSSGWSLRTKLS